MSTRHTPEPSGSGVLFVVATPIGHLDDITLRALTALRDADAILAEDTRHTRGLLSHHGITTRLESFHAHTEVEAIGRLVERLRGGARLALVSDAGTPLVSDPGIRLVAAAREADVNVVATPGASAILAALSVAGLRADRFTFYGFLPRSSGKRRAAVEALGARPEAAVIFAAPHRLGPLLQMMVDVFPNRRVAVCRELTKHFEEVVRGTPEDLLERFGAGAKGEVTVIVEGRDEAEPTMDDTAIDRFVEARLGQGVATKHIARDLAERSQLSRSEAYDRVQRRRDREGQ